MIVAETKPIQEITDMLKGMKRVLVLGCGSCVTVCMSGGAKEAEIMAAVLRTERKSRGKEPSVEDMTILRQCDPEFVEMIRSEVRHYDAILSMACGAGVQGVTEWLRMPVLPAMNTRFIGMTAGKGTWVEACAACGECVLADTGGICPVTTCAKGLLNGPCGGTKKGMCEVGPDVPCAWVRIYERLKELGRLDDFRKIAGAKDWSKTQNPGKYRAGGDPGEEQERG